MRLTPHFTLEELTRTDVRWLAEKNLEEAQPFIPVLLRVAEELLEPIRTMFDAPVRVHSGFRCMRLNALVGGSARSQHLMGEAADFDIDRYDDPSARKIALDRICKSDIEFHQLLIEHGCLHISLPKENGPNGEVAFWHAGQKTIIHPPH